MKTERRVGSRSACLVPRTNGRKTAKGRISSTEVHSWLLQRRSSVRARNSYVNWEESFSRKALLRNAASGKRHSFSRTVSSLILRQSHRRSVNERSQKAKRGDGSATFSSL